MAVVAVWGRPISASGSGRPGSCGTGRGLPLPIVCVLCVSCWLSLSIVSMLLCSLPMWLRRAGVMGGRVESRCVRCVVHGAAVVAGVAVVALCHTQGNRLGAYVGVRWTVAVVVGTMVGGPEDFLPVAGPCHVRAMLTGGCRSCLRGPQCGGLPVPWHFVGSTVPMSLFPPLVLVPRVGRAYPPTLCTVPVACTVPVVGGGGVPHCGKAPAVPPSGLTIVLPVGGGGGGVGPCPCGGVGGRGLHRGFPDWRGCGRTAVVRPLGLVGGGGGCG